LNPELDRTRLIPCDLTARRELPAELIARLWRAGEAVETLRARLLALKPEERTTARGLPEDLPFDDLTHRADEDPLLPPLFGEIRLLPLSRLVADRSLDQWAWRDALEREALAEAEALLVAVLPLLRAPTLETPVSRERRLLSRTVATLNLELRARSDAWPRVDSENADTLFALRESALFFPRRLALPGRPPCIFPSLGFQASPPSDGCRRRPFLWT
jgi:hypothetical protein